MSDWLRNSLSSASIEPWQTLAVRLVAALILGSVVVAIHRATRGRVSDHATTFSATLVMLCVLIAMVTQVIGDNFARAFSLAGVLSIVRFRTVVRDAKDTAFVIFAVVVGMAVGAGQLAVALIGLTTVAAAAAIYRDRPHDLAAHHPRKSLTIKLVWTAPLETLVRSELAKHTTELHPLSAATIRQGSAMELHYRITLLPTASLPQLISDVCALEGVLAAELRAEHQED